MEEQDQKGCDKIHEAVNNRLMTINWVFGIVITLQLLTFSWLGYVSLSVVTMQIDYAATKNVLIEKVNSVTKLQEKLEVKMNQIDNKIDLLSNNHTGSFK